MRGVETRIQEIRHKIFTEVARMAYHTEWPVKDRMEALPYKIIPGEKGNFRNDVFLERAIVGERLRLAMGLPYRSAAEHSPISDGIEAADKDETYYTPPLINVIKFACNACPEKRVHVTDGCQGCLAHPCMEVCPKDAVSLDRTTGKGLSFEECVIRLTQMFVFEKQEDIKKSVIEEFKDNPISHLFGKSLINAQGQTVLALHPLDIHDPEKDPKLMELHMYQNALEKQKVAGDIWVKNALIIIRDKFVIDKSMVEFLVKDNPIIPDGRERIFQSGLYMFLNGDYYEALHILAPQVENLFRNIAREVGGLTVTLEKDGSSMEKVLSSILSLPELVDCYDNDILFTFRGLLNEQAGANIRNEIAHGIISEYACSTGVCLYFGVAVIKLLSLTSASCYQILKNSEKLKHFEMPRKDALKVIH